MKTSLPPPSDRPREFVSWERDRWMFEAGGVGILMYHKVCATPLSTNWAGLYVGAERFARQMDELMAAGVPPIPYGDVARATEADEAGFCVSFDDGFRNVFEHALPALQARSLRAIQFIVADRIGRDDEWDHAIGEPPTPLMDEAQIRDWLAAGHEIGSHTLTHPHLTAVPRDRACSEIADSKKRLEDRFGIPIRHFCYPYGDQNEAIRDLVAEAGYRTAPTVEFGTNTRGAQPLALRRIMACNARSRLGAAARRGYRLAQSAQRRIFSS